MTIGLVTKKLDDGSTAKDYEKIYSQFTHYIEDVNQKWEKIKKKHSNIEPSFPDQIACVEIESVKDNIVIYHTLNRFVKRDKSGIPGNLRYKIMGYALGRFHSQEYTKVSLDPYKSYFTYLNDVNMENKVVSTWEKEFEKIKGSSYIVGDCSLENIQYNALPFRDTTT